jgi:hypothetical protein
MASHTPTGLPPSPNALKQNMSARSRRAPSHACSSVASGNDAPRTATSLCHKSHKRPSTGLRSWGVSLAQLLHLGPSSRTVSGAGIRPPEAGATASDSLPRRHRVAAAGITARRKRHQPFVLTSHWLRGALVLVRPTHPHAPKSPRISLVLQWPGHRLAWRSATPCPGVQSLTRRRVGSLDAADNEDVARHHEDDGVVPWGWGGVGVREGAARLCGVCVRGGHGGAAVVDQWWISGGRWHVQNVDCCSAGAARAATAVKAARQAAGAAADGGARMELAGGWYRLRGDEALVLHLAWARPCESGECRLELVLTATVSAWCAYHESGDLH